jgi:hypothetical protein
MIKEARFRTASEPRARTIRSVSRIRAARKNALLKTPGVERLGAEMRAGGLGPVGGQPCAGRARWFWLAVASCGARYLRMLAGLPDVKPDRVVIRFIAPALDSEDRSIDADQALALVRAAVEHFGVDQRALDHEIWEY